MAFWTSMMAAASSDVCTNMANVEPGGSGPSTASLVLIFKTSDCKSLSSCNKCSSSLEKQNKKKTMHYMPALPQLHFFCTHRNAFSFTPRKLKTNFSIGWPLWSKLVRKSYYGIIIIITIIPHYLWLALPSSPLLCREGAWCQAERPVCSGSIRDACSCTLALCTSVDAQIRLQNR